MFKQQKEKIDDPQESFFDEVRMECNQSNFYTPLLNAVVNDSLQFKVFFDTGFPSKYFIASDSLKSVLKNDSASVQIGKSKMLMGIDYIENYRGSIFDIFGKNTILLGWEFFKGRVIELSFKDQYIRVYNSLPNLSGYTKIKITPTSHLAIPIKVVMQGKTMEDTVFIDTGNNAYASFSTELVKKYGINIEGAYHGKSMTNVGLYSGFSLPVDTINIGGLYVANKDMTVAFRPKTKNRPVGGLLGVKSLQKFSVFLDLIKYDLYLKPLNLND
jgi:predicted aspartyl protease